MDPSASARHEVLRSPVMIIVPRLGELPSSCNALPKLSNQRDATSAYERVVHAETRARLVDRSVIERRPVLVEDAVLAHDFVASLQTAGLIVHSPRSEPEIELMIRCTLTVLIRQLRMRRAYRGAGGTS